MSSVSQPTQIIISENQNQEKINRRSFQSMGAVSSQTHGLAISTGGRGVPDNEVLKEKKKRKNVETCGLDRIRRVFSLVPLFRQ
jgi:hypothetical protein